MKAHSLIHTPYYHLYVKTYINQPTPGLVYCLERKKIMETKVNSKTIFEGKIFKVTHDDVFIEKTQSVAKREIVHHHGGVGIVAYYEDKVLLVRQYRYAVGEYTLEIPAGKLEKDEDPANCALREIEEETGYQANGIEKIATILATPGYCNEHLHIYLTKDVKKVEKPRLGDEDEDIEMHWYPLKDCIDMIKKGEIVDAKTVIGIMALKAL